ncbi:phage tail protein [Pectinatus frisingensis]|uniref:phage tail protein n=1 Tax=Pectinatus frisingensis TaxID=865 RepID=UPI0018C57953|nr:phage tail protein [Pectinatus frisingensis]
MTKSRKKSGYILIAATLASIVYIMISMAFFTIFSGQFSMISAGRTAMQAQQYADVVANTLKLQSIDDIIAKTGGEIALNDNNKLALNTSSDSETKHNLSDLLGNNDSWADWQYNISIADGPANSTSDADDAIVQKIATVRIFKNGDTLPRYSEEVPLSSQGSNTNVPIGTIIIWPTANWYQDMKAVGGNPDNYLECDGQAVDAANYPKLAKIMSTVPNYQGLFLRGFGGNSETIGQVQSDAIRNITGTVGYWNDDYGIYTTGVFYTSIVGNTAQLHGGTGEQINTYFDASRVVPTANENRPINTAVIYLIKAK